MLFLIRIAVFALIVSCAPAVADDIWPPAAAPTDALPGHPGKTFLDLIALVIPDIEEKDGTFQGTNIIPMRHIDGHPAEAPGVMNLDTLSVLNVNSDGKPHVALFFTLGETPGAVESFSLLALFDVAGEPRLLDAVAVGYDRFTSLYGQHKMPVSAGSDVILTMSSHSNSNQAYLTTLMILVRGDRFDLIDSIFTLDERACTYERVQVPRYEARPGAARFADIRVSITDSITLTGFDCGDDEKPEPMSRTITTIYRWHIDEKKYVPDDDALEQLQDENKERL